MAQAMEMAEVGEKYKFSSNFDMTILAMVEHNLGITIMPRLILEGSHADVAAIPISPPISRSLGMARALHGRRFTRDAALYGLHHEVLGV